MEETKPLTDLEKLKSDNEAFEKELLRAREMRAEKQKIDAELLLGSTAGQPVKIEPPKQISNIEYANKLMKGEVNPLKEDDISIN